ncbi:MAG: DMT family transporter [Bacteroidota bacterium]
MNNQVKGSNEGLLTAQILLHISILLFGFSAILGKLIDLPGTHIVWYRMLITCISLGFFPGIIQKIRKIPRKDLVKIGGIGVIITMHWVGFYEAIKYANASITVSCMASMTIFTALLEPLYFRRPIKKGEILLGIIIIGGFLLMFGFIGDQYALGMTIALISALLAAIFSVLNKSIVSSYDVFAITQVQFIIGWIFLTLLAPVYVYLFPGSKLLPSEMDWGYLIILALICTTLAYSMNMYALRFVSAFANNLAFNMEPIYGILLAYFLLREDKEMNSGFYFGAGIILLSVVGHGIWTWRQKKRKLQLER